MKKVWLGFMLCVSVCLMPWAGASAAPKSDLWPYWQQHDNDSKHSVNHDTWQDFLKKYVVVDSIGNHMVKYASVTAKDKQVLVNYVNELSNTAVTTLSKDEQLAYWINLYNAHTIEVVLAHWPVDSILEISAGFIGLFANNGPWDRNTLVIEGKDLSLNDIEHRILRPIWQNPEIHFGLNCASIGCPNLALTVYQSHNVMPLLHQQGLAFMQSAKGLDFRQDALVLSKIFDWFQVDFGNTEAEVLTFVRQYLTDEQKKTLSTYKGDIEYAYDWQINSA